MAQNSTKKQRNIIIASVIIVVLVVSSIAGLIVFYHQPSTKPKPTQVNVNVAMNQTNVIQGSNLQAEVNVTSIGNSENVTLGSNTGSSGIQCRFEPSTGKSNFTSTLTLSVPDTTPTGNYTVTVTATGNKEAENASYVISVLSATVTVSGTVNISALAAVGISSLSQIQFTDTQTDSTVAYSFPSSYPPVATNDIGTYSVTLQNEHTYNITLVYFWGITGAIPKYTADDGNFTVFAPAGNSMLTGQNFNL